MNTMRLVHSVWAVGLLTVLGLTPALAETQTSKGLQLPATRVIYPSQETQGITFTVTNKALEPFLIQSRVTPWQATPQGTPTTAPITAPFIVTPPLERLDAGEALTLRIRETKKGLPTDRESVFGFHVKAIPSQTEATPTPATAQGQQVQMALALQYTLKLFYRPQALPTYDAAQIASALQFTREGAQLVVNNPTAFYVTFDTLTLADTPLDRDALFEMVPPFGKQTYPLPKSVSQGTLSWSIVTDIGDKTGAQTRALTSSTSSVSIQNRE